MDLNLKVNLRFDTYKGVRMKRCQRCAEVTAAQGLMLPLRETLRIHRAAAASFCLGHSAT